jgi:preprotein translocase subunit SecA
MDDVVYKTAKAKYEAVCREIEECYREKRPVLVGTVSIEKSEHLSALLKKRNIPHNVLNAKNHEREAEIVAQAGQAGSVTIATNMAGRGTDIVLGPGVADKGGLHIIGTERHESRRIDNQLRGRAGRQGDPGSSHFFLSLEDDLLRIFNGERIKSIMDRFDIPEDEPIESKLINKAIANAQRKVEAHNYDIRKHLLEYDDVLNKQREVVYELRKLILAGQSTRELVQDILREQLDGIVRNFAQSNQPSDWDRKAIQDSLVFLVDSTLGTEAESFWTPLSKQDALVDALFQRAVERYRGREQEMGENVVRQLEQIVYLGSIDQQWKDHLLAMDHLKEGVGLRGYGQKDPLVEYKKEGFNLFRLMDEQVKTDVIAKLFRVQITREEQVEEMQPKKQEMQFFHGGDDAGASKAPVRKSEGERVGRNDPCPCGSGKKYKKCHGANVSAET